MAISVANNSLDNVQRLPFLSAGQSDPDFARKMILANALGSLMQAAHECGEQLRRDGVALTRENLKSALVMAVGTVRPRSMLCGWVTDDRVIEQLIGAAVANFFDGVHREQ
jgi:hypothetical protein